MPLDLIRVGDLGHWLRSKKNEHEQAGKPPIRIKTAWDAIQRFCILDDSGAALTEHRLRVQQAQPSYPSAH